MDGACFISEKVHRRGQRPEELLKAPSGETSKVSAFNQSFLWGNVSELFLSLSPEGAHYTRDVFTHNAEQ